MGTWRFQVLPRNLSSSPAHLFILEPLLTLTQGAFPKYPQPFVISLDTRYRVPVLGQELSGAVTFTEDRRHGPHRQGSYIFTL